MQHPSQLLSEDDIHLIRSYSLIAEGQGELTPAQLQLIYNRRWFKVMVPEYASGLELSLPETMRLLEAAAWADGSFGWVLNLGAGANMFAAFLPAGIAKKLFIHPKICIAGSGALSGKAEKIDGGYIVNGTWKYASGASHGSFFSVSCILTQNGEPTKDKKGGFKTRSFIIPKHQVIISRLWNSYGLKATASHDFKVEDVLVPNDLSFSLIEPSMFADGPFIQIPVFTIGRSIISSNNERNGLSFH